ncbi:MAG TPA: PAS domain-containing protein [Atribacteraceae bacterium]|nr:PAS domain-containing protein [Atribacteraceae bacterium]
MRLSGFLDFLEDFPQPASLVSLMDEVIFVNSAGLSFFGFEPDLVNGQTVSAVFGEQLGRFMQENRPARSSQKAGTFIEAVSVRSPSQEVSRMVDVSCTPLRPEDVDRCLVLTFSEAGKTVNEIARTVAESRYRATWNDFSGSIILAERNVHILQTLIENLPDLVYIKDRQSRFITSNRVHLNVLGLTGPEEVLGRTDYDFFPPATAREFYEDEQRVMENGTPLVNKEEVIRNGKTGEMHWFLSTKVPLRDAADNIVGLVGISRDITERKKAEDVLLKHRDFEKMVLMLATIFINLPLERVDEGIEKLLCAIGEFQEVDRSYVFQFTDEHCRIVNNTHGWCRGGVTPQINRLKNLSTDLFPWGMGKLQSREVIHIPRVAALPPEAQAEKALLLSQSCRSVLVFPLALQGHLVGFIGFDTVYEEKEWTEKHIVLLQLVGEILSNILERKQMDTLLSSERNLLQTLIDAIPDQIYSKDLQGHYAMANTAFLDFFNFPSLDALKGSTDRSLLPPALFRTLRSDDHRLLEEGLPAIHREIKLPGGEWFLATKVFLKDQAGEIIGLVGVNRNISEQKRAEEQVKYLLFHDPVTRLYNRVFLEEEFRRLNTPRQFPLGVVIGNVNGLRLVNDVFGHREGDRLLERIAEVLKNTCREEDIIARWGGDEFIILLPQTPLEKVPDIVHRIRTALREADPDPVALSLSLGYAVKNHRKEDYADIIRLAEDRMFENRLAETREVRRAFIASLERLFQEKTQENEAHALRMRTLARKMGQAAALSEEEIGQLDMLARFHDLGTVAVSRHILGKAETLSSQEWEEVRRHPEIGYRIARVSSELAPIAEAILAHHERWDGDGYPYGRKAEEIPVLSRIIAILDTFDAMTSGRSYKPPASL